MTDRELLLKTWDETWNSPTWFPSWKQAFAGLTPQQAAWKPAPKRNSIWQNLNHIAFWRETVVNRLAGKPPSEDEVNRKNFEEPSEMTDAAWTAAQKRFEDAHNGIRKAMADTNTPAEKFHYLLAHDAYHMGQIMYVRALQGLPAIEYT